MRVLGMNCAPRVAYLAIIEDATPDSSVPERLQAPPGLETGRGCLSAVPFTRSALWCIQSYFKPDTPCNSEVRASRKTAV
jgi:hypothetical protein